MIVLSKTPDQRGKGKFLTRLIKEIAKHDVQFVHDSKLKHDLELGLVRFTFNSGAPKIQRIDGLWYNKQDARHRNANNQILKHYNRAQGHIFQSEFCKFASHKMFGARSRIPNAIIYNGADPEFYRLAPGASSPAKFNIIASAQWRKHKRLKHIVIAFTDWKNNQDSILWVAGHTKDFKLIKHPRVRYLGNLQDEELAGYLRMADVCVHIGYVDACPNSVVESINAGTPIICSNQGGTPEIVGKSGLIMNLDKGYNWNKFDTDHPPGVSVEMVAKGYERFRLGQVKYDMNRPDLHIKATAYQYYKFFKRVLNG